MSNLHWIWPAASIGLGVGSLLAALRRPTPAGSLRTTPGRIMRSSVRIEDDFYWANIVYEYVVDGVRYENNVVSLGGDIGWTLKSPAEATAMRFAAGAEATVYYEAARPQTSCLIPSARKRRLLFLAIGVFAIAIGISLLWSGGLFR